MESSTGESESKRQKMESSEEQPVRTCKHFVKRKKRFCRIPVYKDDPAAEYCGEHLPTADPSKVTTENGEDSSNARIPCPLDPKHTLFAKNLRKHLKICNVATALKDQPDYISPGLNAGPKDSDSDLPDFKLADVDNDTVEKLVNKINEIYEKYAIDEKIIELFKSHQILESETSREDSAEHLKHLRQTSAILGYLDHFKLYKDKVSYVEYGAGKGAVSYWLAHTITDYPNSKILLIDRASLRNKKDNKLEEKYAQAVQRIRADIADFAISKHPAIQETERIVGIGKHLCGAATDFAIRCSLNGNKVAEESGSGPRTDAVIIALCCHHRCEWKHLVGKEFFMQNGVSVKEFATLTKMVGWAICGTGKSRERRKQIEEEKLNGTFEESEIDYELIAKRKAVGMKCKRLIDFARICYLEKNGYECFLNRYVGSDVTLENVCLVALLKKEL